MKIFHGVILFILQLLIQSITSTSFSQVPDKLNYQAVIRNSKGEVLAGQPVGIRIQVKQGSEFGGAVYIEIHNVTTNENGLAALEIGAGLPVLGSFGEIPWENGPYFLQTEIDPLGGTSYSISGTSQLLSVPYAWLSKTAGSISGKITETDRVFQHSVAGAITVADTARWNSKLDSFSETDPVFAASMAKGISEADIINWNGKVGAETQTLGDVLTNNWDGKGMQIKNIAEPTDPQDAATRSYADKLLTRINQLKYYILNGNSVSDFEGNVYKTIMIGKQLWMAENLKSTFYNDGNPIPQIKYNEFKPGYNWYQNDESTYKVPYGALYLWYTVGTGKLCPVGWHVSTQEDWEELIAFVGGDSIAGGKLKEAGNSHWINSAVSSTDSYGFSALPGGTKYVAGHQISTGFIDIGKRGIYWTTSIYEPPVGSGVPYSRVYEMYYDSKAVFFLRLDADSFASVRCVKD